MTRITITILINIFLLSCCIRDMKKDKKKNFFSIISPSSLQNFKLNDTITFIIKSLNKNYKIDSINILCNNNNYSIIKSPENNFKCYINKAKTGLNNIDILIYYDNKIETHSLNLVFKSNIIPKNLNYKIVKKYPHNKNSYTQGLLWYNGYLYESAGRKGMSNLCKIDLRDNEVLKEYKLENNYFAEGIALINDKLYQITWQDKTGFIYDSENLNLLTKFEYNFNEAWGLTSNNNKFYMSDGSHYIYVIEPQTFTQIDLIEVYDDKTKIEKLNELEYVCGNILANVYGESYIVIFDLLGRVVAKVNFQELIDEKYKNNYDYVLNGIAYNPENQHFFITGKMWDYIYEVEIPDFFKLCVPN